MVREMEVAEFVKSLENLGSEPVPRLPANVVMRPVTPVLGGTKSFEAVLAQDTLKSADIKFGASPRVEVKRALVAPQTESIQLMWGQFAAIDKMPKDNRRLCTGEQLYCRPFRTEGWKRSAAGHRVLAGNIDHPLGKGSTGNLLLIEAQNRIFGTMTVDGEVFKVRQVAPSQFAIVTSAFAEREPDDVASKGVAPLQAPAPRPCPNPPRKYVVDILVAVTPEASDRAASEENTVPLLLKYSAELYNKSFKNSNIDAEVNLVDVMDVDYKESGSFVTDVEALVSGNGNLKQVQERRRMKKADVAVMIVNDKSPTYCGMAAMYRAPKEKAYAVVNWRCLTNQFGLIHEVGHLVGAYHDPATEGVREAVPSYAYGYVRTGEAPIATIMGYRTACKARCGRDWYWADPEIKDESGRPMGTYEKSYDACIWRQRLPEVAAFDGG